MWYLELEPDQSNLNNMFDSRKPKPRLANKDLPGSQIVLSSLDDNSHVQKGNTNQNKINAIQRDLNKYFEFLK